MPMTSKEMIRFLENNGFTWIKSGDGSHRKFKNFETGKVTQVPYHGNKTLPRGTERAILKQAGLL